MARFPEVQRKAQSEIDKVIGNDRLPTLSDREQLPYINALCLEVLRWQPVAPLGLPHRLIQDDVHAGYFLPEGTIVIPNIWNFLHDPQTYTDPFQFNPERFLSAGNKDPEKDPRQVVFGFGRRICPGMHLAEASLFLSCAMTLAVFNIGSGKNTGAIMDPNLEYSTGTISHPPPFDCSLHPRSAKAGAIIDANHESR